MPDVKLVELSADGRLLTRPDLDFTFDTADRFLAGPTFISGLPVAVQDVLRALLTRLGTNPMAPGFGTTLSGLVGTRNYDDASGQISRDVQSSLGYLASLRADGDLAERVTEIISLSTLVVQGTIQTKLKVRSGTGQTATVVTA